MPFTGATKGPGGMLPTLDSSIMEKSCPCCRKKKLTLVIVFPSLYIILLSKPQIRDIQNTVFIAVIFNTALLLMKDVTSQPNKCGIGFKLMEFTGVTIFPSS